MEEEKVKTIPTLIQKAENGGCHRGQAGGSTQEPPSVTAIRCPNKEFQERRENVKYVIKKTVNIQATLDPCKRNFCIEVNIKKNGRVQTATQYG